MSSTMSTSSSVSGPASPAQTSPLLRAAGVFSVVSTLALCVLLVVNPQAGLFVFWRLVAPLVPLMMYLLPAVWEHSCPTEQFFHLPRLLGATPTRERSAASYLWWGILGVVVLVATVAARRPVLNNNGSLLALLIMAMLFVAFLEGWAFKQETAHTSAICPLHPMQRLLARIPLFGRARPAAHDEVAFADLLMAAIWPGLIWAYHAPPLVLGEWLAYPALIAASAVVVFGLAQVIKRRDMLLALVALVSLGLFYWFNLPQMFGAISMMGDIIIPQWLDLPVLAVLIVVLLAQVPQILGWSRRAPAEVEAPAMPLPAIAAPNPELIVDSFKKAAPPAETPVPQELPTAAELAPQPPAEQPEPAVAEQEIVLPDESIEPPAEPIAEPAEPPAEPAAADQPAAVDETEQPLEHTANSASAEPVGQSSFFAEPVELASDATVAEQEAAVEPASTEPAEPYVPEESAPIVDSLIRAPTLQHYVPEQGIDIFEEPVNVFEQPRPWQQEAYTEPAEEPVAEETEPPNTPSVLKPSLVDRSIRSVAVIGSGITGLTAAYEISRNHPTCAVHLLGYGNEWPAATDDPRLTGAWLNLSDLALSHERIVRREHASVLWLMPQQREVVLSNGEIISFDRLILATGSVATPPEIKGFGLEGTYALGAGNGSAAVHEFVLTNNCRYAVVADRQLPGMLAALELLGLGLTVTVVGNEPLLSEHLDGTGSAILQAHLANFSMLRLVEASPVMLSGGQRVHNVILTNGQTLQADIFFAPAPLSPNVQLAAQAGLAVERGVVVDDEMRTSDGSIFAAGDAVSWHDVTMEPWPAAMVQARVAALNALGGHETYTGTLPAMTININGLDIATFGRTRSSGGDHVLVLDEQERMRYRRLLIRDGMIIGATLIGFPEYSHAVHQAISNRVDVTSFMDALVAGEWSVLGG